MINEAAKWTLIGLDHQLRSLQNVFNTEETVKGTERADENGQCLYIQALCAMVTKLTEW